MNTIAFPNPGSSLPNFERLANAIKTIKRGRPAVKDGAYAYFAETIQGAAGAADSLGNQWAGVLTSLPRSLDDMLQAVGLLESVARIDEAERSGATTAEKAAAARDQLQGKFTEALTSTLGALTSGGESLSAAARELVQMARKIDARATDAHATETANLARTKATLEGAKTRLKVLDERLSKLNAAVDKKRGGPTEDLLSVLPDEEELTSLLDLGAEDAAAPELAVAKKSVELAMSQLKKVMKLVDKVVEFQRLCEIRDRVFDAREAQSKVVVAAQSGLEAVTATLGVLDTVISAREALTAMAEETTTLSRALEGFAAQIQSLDGERVTGAAVSKIGAQAKGYLAQAQAAYNEVVLG